MFEQLPFLVIATIILVFSFMTVQSRKVLRSAVYLLFVLIATAVLYFMMNYNFLAAVQLTVYAGGIVVLIIFSILLTSHINDRTPKVPYRRALLAGLATVAGALLTIMVIVGYAFIPSNLPAVGTNIHDIGRALVCYSREGYALPFEVISVLLLAAMIGAIVVAKKEPIHQGERDHDSTNSTIDSSL
jgi:NADH-quinone oxidoreductase subunit J